MVTKIMKRPKSLNLHSMSRPIGLALGVVLLSHCSAPVSVRMEKPVAPVGAPAATGRVDDHLASIRNAYDRIRRGDESAIPAYNYSVSRLVEELERSGADPWSGTISYTGTSGTFRLTGSHPAGSHPLDHKLISTDTLFFRGDITKEQSKVDGVGAPMVEVGALDKLGHEKIRDNLPMRNLTAIVRFDGNLANLELVDPYQVERVSLGGRSRQLAADYGAAVMLAMSKARVDKLGLVRLLRPSRYNDTANLNFMQPYDPKRIPVLFVHGLDSTPATFAPMYFKLLQDPEIREHYQFWVFSYPSGYPYPYSAVLLRRELDDVKREFPNHRGMVIIGHSMGSMISRLMVTDAGDKLWFKAFGHNPSETRITGHSRKLLQEALIFEDRKEIDRAVFYSGPHRGSMIANNWIGSTAARLVKAPGLIADLRNTAISAATADTAGLMMQRAPNSIGTLSPDNPFVLAVHELPIVSRVPYHTIVGDRGKGDTPDSSDGVVAYWSSHLDSAVSEKIVPSGHGSHENPEGIEEARRILQYHLKSNL
jgi:pimeloyl-ACP methyl ester carboxylesterase